MKRPSGGTVRSGRLSRALDFHVGRIVLWVLGRHRRARTPVRDPATIGLCAFGAIGDALLSSAIAGDLKRRYPDARVVMVVTRSNAGIAPLLRHCDGVLVLPIFSPGRTIALMRRQRFDLLIDANQWLRISAVYCALARAGHTIGFRTPGQHRHFAFDAVATHSATRHELGNYRALLAAAGLPGASEPELELPQRDQQAARDLAPAPYVVLHPWAGGGQAALKEWPTGHWVLLGRALAAKGYALVVTGAGGDVGKATLLVEASHRAAVPMLTVAGRLNLSQTACLLERAALVVAVNTGVMHIAAALGVPLVALHGPTNPDRWGPVSRNAVSVLPGPVPLGVPVGYLNLGFEFPSGVPDCMAFIPVERVIAAAAVMTSERPGAAAAQPADAG